MSGVGKNAFGDFWDGGYRRLVPITPPLVAVSQRSTLAKNLKSLGKAPGIKSADGLWRGIDFLKHETTRDDLAKWHAMGAGTGIRTGGQLVAIDADTLDENQARIIRDVIKERLGELPLRVGKYPKALYLVRVPDAIRYTRIEFEQADGKEARVELLCEGRQFVAEGIHPDTGMPYTWPKPLVPFDELPQHSAAAVLAVLEALRPLLPEAKPLIHEGSSLVMDQDSLRGDPDIVRQAVAVTPNTNALFPSRDAYRDFGYAIKAALPDDEAEALEIFQDWCTRWDGGDNDPDVVEADWRRMKPPFRRGASWLYAMADDHGGGRFKQTDVWFDQITAVDNPFAEVARAAARDAAAPRTLTFLSFADTLDFSRAELATPLVKGLLDQGAMTVLYGESNVGKSFVATDLAFHIAAGLPWAGMKVTQTAVAYVAAEGGRGARKRIEALRRKFPGVPREVPLHSMMETIDLLDPRADVGPLIAAVKGLGVPVGLIVIDTLSRAMAGGDENASTDMGVMVKHLDAVRAATGAHLMAVHHSGKDKARGARGHSLLRAAADTEIEITDGQINVTKQRDMDKSFSTAFNLDVVVLGTDSDGDAITSCTVSLVQRGDVRTGVATPREQEVLEALNALETTNAPSVKGVPLVEITEFLEGSASPFTAENTRAHLRNLHKKKLVTAAGRGKWASANRPSGLSLLEPLGDEEIGYSEEIGRKIGSNVFH